MTTHRSLAAALWLLAAAVAFVICTAWAGEARSGKMPPWALVAVVWGAAGVSVAIHYLSQGPEALRRYRLSLAPAARRGAWLRGRVWRPTLAMASHRLASGLAFVRRHLAAQFALIAGIVPARVQRPQPVDAVGPDAAAESRGKRMEFVGQVEAA
jgi:hypothetical protein